MNDPFVAAVQEKLIARGYSVGAAGADGIAGAATTAAIKAFQAKSGVEVTGTVTAATWDALDSEPMPERDLNPPSAEPAHIKPIWPRQAECMKVYGAVGQNQTILILPFPMRIAWDTAKTITKITLHEKVRDSAARVFDRIADAYSADKRKDLGIDLFGGSLSVRKMRGGSSWSMHSWGIAIDFDPIRNQLKWPREKARLGRPDAEAFWKLWEEEGWVSLGRARNYDWMHVQAARL